MSETLTHQAPTVLIVDDDEAVLQSADLLLRRRGLRVLMARAPSEVRGLMGAEPVDVILLDLNFSQNAISGDEGLGCLADIVAQDPAAVVVVVTGHSGINVAVNAMRAGASDFVMKPWRNDRFVAAIESAVALRRRRRGSAADEGEASDTVLVGESAGIRRVRDLIQRAAPTQAPVFIHGEAGTGKSLAARSLHGLSERVDGPLVTVDLSDPDESRVAERLFGDDGALAHAHGGLLVLDEVAALSLYLQGRLAAWLARSAASGDSSRMVALSRRPPGPHLREDLLYQLNTVEIALPALRDRDGDAALLADYFLRLFARRHGRSPRRLDDEASRFLAEASWPGHVRELRQAVERVVILTEGDSVGVRDFRLVSPQPEPQLATASRDLNLGRSERALVEAALQRNGFNVSRAAEQLGLTRAALYRRMAKHGL